MNDTCHDCGAKEGEIHQRGCDMEKCPFCGGQLISCNCRYTKLGMNYDHDLPYSGLPPEVYKKGLPDDLDEKWEEILKEKGRVPYIIYPCICARCGEKWPRGQMYPDWLWHRYIPIAMRNCVLCDKCFGEIKELIDERANLRPIEWVECPFCKENCACNECQGSGKMDRHAIPDHRKRLKEHNEMMAKMRQVMELSK